MNPEGHTETLVASHPGNTNNLKSGIYSRTGRVLAERAEQIAQALMDAPHVVTLDSVAAEEIGTVLAQIEAVDKELERGGRRDRRSLMEARIKLTRELRTWLREFGATPKSRAEFARELAQGGLAAQMARARAEREKGDNGA